MTEVDFYALCRAVLPKYAFVWGVSRKRG